MGRSIRGLSGGATLHVYSPRGSVLKRKRLLKLLGARRWFAALVDPHDFCRLSGGAVDNDWLLGARTEGLLDDVLSGFRRGRKNVLRSIGIKGEVARCGLMIEAPFVAEKILGPLEGLQSTFGEDGLRHLRLARSLYGINAPSRASKVSQELLRDSAEVIAEASDGVTLDFANGTFRRSSGRNA